MKKGNSDLIHSDLIHALWDELADFDAARGDDAIGHLMSSLCELVQAQNVSWVGAVRLADIVPGDPVRGWRPRTIRHLHPSRQVDAAAQEQMKLLEKGSVDETTIRNVAQAGKFRAINRAGLMALWLGKAG